MAKRAVFAQIDSIDAVDYACPRQGLSQCLKGSFYIYNEQAMRWTTSSWA
jgi:hypothetical protein